MAEEILGEYGPAHKNTAGFMVPVAMGRHLSFWLHQVPLVEIGQPDIGVMALYQTCCVGEAATTAIPAEIRDHFLVRVFEKRMVANGLVPTPWLCVFIAGISRSPAYAVMWAFFLKVQAVSLNTNLVSMEDVGRIFPKGLPTEAGMLWMWDLQKLGSDSPHDNLLDHVRMAPSET